MSASHAPTVSVIIPCYNQAGYLPEAVASIQAQTIPDWECIIINDGSTDNTAEVASALSALDARIRCLNQPNGGLSRARNRGLDEARGQYIQFLDADDFIAPDKFELQSGMLSSAKGLALAYCDYDYCSSDGRVLHNDPVYRPPVLDADRPLQDLALGWETKVCIPPHAFLFDTRFFTELRIRFDEELSNHEDWDCWMQILALSPAVFRLDRKLAMYRSSENSMSRAHVSMRLGFLWAIRKQRELFRDDPEMYALLTKKIAITKRAYRDYAPLRRAWLRITRGPRLYLRRVLSAETKRRIEALLHRAQDRP